jgi:hypothetical protein
MPYPAVAPEVHESLDVHGDLPTQVTFDGERGNGGANGLYPVLGQVLQPGAGLDPGGSADFGCPGPTDAVDCRQSDNGVLSVRYVDTRNTCHR